MKNFFVSYNKADSRWAEWIAWQLEEAGYSVILQAWDFHAGGNFIQDMHKAAVQADRTIAVLSPDYLKASFTQPEWSAAFRRDPTGEKALLVPVRVAECEVEGILEPIVYIDLVGLGEADAKASLLKRIKGERLKPSEAPRFPGQTGHVPAAPSFPGNIVRDYSRLVFEQSLVGSGDELFSIAFSRDGNWVAAGSNHKVFLWNRRKPRRPKILKGHESYVYSVAFSSDSKYLATGSEDRSVRVWDVATGGLVWNEAQKSEHDDSVYSVAFSPDGRRVASGGYDKVVKLWNAGDGQLLRSSDRALDGVGRVTSVAFSPNGNVIAAGSLDDTVRLWDLKEHRQHILQGHASSVEAVAYSPDGSLLASCGLDKTVRVWDTAKRSEIWSRRGHEYLVRSVAFSPDGATLASAGWDKTVQLWDSKSGEITKTLPFKKGDPWHTDWIWSVAFSPEGMMLASSGSDGQIILWLVAGVEMPGKETPASSLHSPVQR